MTTRRTFLKQSALAGAGILLASNGFANIINPNKNLTVVCLGGGLAGLSAAYQLKKKGFNVIVLESQNRVGGRIFSHQITPELIIELGGEWVGNSHTRMQELCSEFNLELQNNQFDTHLIYKGEYSPPGKWDYSEQWNSKFKKILADYEHLSEEDLMELDKYDWWRFLVNNGCEGHDLDLRELLDSTDFGESIRHVSAFAALAEYAESSEKNEMDLKIKGGNKMLPEKLADAIGRENILVGHTVTKIEQTDKVKITCSNGKTFTADKVICTLPTFAMSKIDWQPGLPKEMVSAIQQLQYARINKHAVLFDQRFWKDESFDMVTDELPHYFYHATKNQKAQQGVLISYSIGEKAAVVANRPKDKMRRDIHHTLSPHFGNVESLVKDQVNYYWGNDQNSRGAYALYGIGQWFSLKPILGKAFNHVHFAGEHIADWQGFMEGAVNTGEAAAEEII
jgi:monoamine oxidase